MNPLRNCTLIVIAITVAVAVLCIVERRPLESSAAVAQPDAASKRTVPGGIAARVRPPNAASPFDAFSEWASRYLTAAPDERRALRDEGIALASARRVELRRLIEADPRAAIERAVPPALRQDLPREVAERLEERVNERAFFGVLGVLPSPENPNVPPYAREVRTRDGGRYRAFVYGRRAGQPTTENASIVGIAVDDVIALDERPLRVVETGEIPNHPNNLIRRRPLVRVDERGYSLGRELSVADAPARPLVATCPVSGKITAIPPNENGAPGPVTSERAVVEAAGEIHYLCTGGHIHAFEEQLVAGEGGNGGPTLPTTPPAVTQSTGYRTNLLMRVAFPESRRPSVSEKEAHDLAMNVQDWLLDSSYGAMTLMTTVTPVLILPRTEAWYKNEDSGNAFEVLTDARAAAKEAGFDWAQFHLDTVIYTGSPGSFSGQAYVAGRGCWLKSGTGVGVPCHEYGHNFGLWHANFWNTTNGSTIGAGSHVEYGDIFDTMGPASAGDLQFNAMHKNKLAWIANAQVHEVTANGTYRIYQMDQPRLDPALRYALKVRKDTSREYWVDLRQRFTSNPWVQGGVFLHWAPWSQSAQGTHLLDATPGSPDGRSDATIVIGRTFSDLESGIHITPIAKHATVPPSVDLVVNAGAFPGNGAPTLSLAAGASVAAIDEAITFTATAADPDGDPLSYAWEFGDRSFSTANAEIVAKSWAAAGEYRVRCTASDMKGHTASASAIVTVGEPGTFRVSGAITLGGQPMANVRVHNGLTGTSYRGTFTDNDGTYAIVGLGAGSYTIGAELYGYTFSPAGSANVTLGPSKSGVDFVANDLPRVTISAPDGDASEDGDPATLRLARTGSTTAALTVSVLSPSGSAARNTDYSFAPDVTPGTPFFTITIPAGQQFVEVVVIPFDDGTQESFERVTIELVPNASYVLGEAVATVWIADNDTTNPLVRMRVPDRDADEAGDLGQFKIERIGSTESTLDVSISISGSAANGSDYVAIPATITIPAGSSSAPVVVTPIQDSQAEPMETVVLSINTSANYVRAPAAADNSGTVNLHDDDLPAITVAAFDSTASEAGNDPAIFTITRSGSTSLPLTVNYGIGGSALHGTDYAALPGVLTIPAGSDVGTVVITPIDDSIGEPVQTVTLQLRSGAGYAVAPANNATVTISDDGDAPYATINSATAPAAEPGTSGTFRITTTGSGSGDVTIRYTVTGTATNGVDFAALPGSVTMGKNATSSVTIAPIDDSEAEGYETVTLTLEPDPSYSLALDASATMNIGEDEAPQVNVSTTDDTFFEVTGSIARFFVSRTGSTGLPLTVNYTLSGTATAGDDYSVPTGSVTIGAGSAGTLVDVEMIDDSLAEGVETLVLNISPGAAYTIGIGSATRYIADAESSSVTIQAGFASSTSIVVENAGALNVPVTLSEAAAGEVRVEYFVSGGTALGAGIDFALPPGVLIFAPGEVSKDVPVLIHDDSLDEPGESFTITLANAASARLATATHAVTITDDDPPVAAAVGFAAPALSGPESQSPAPIAVFLNAAQAGTVTVDFAVTDGTATNGADYTITAGTLTFAPGETVKVIPNTIASDTEFESAETIILTLSNPVGAALSANTAHVYTINDDDTSFVTIAATDASASEEGQNTGLFTISRTGAIGGAITVNLAISGTATNGVDVETIAATATIDAGASSTTVLVTPIDDAIGESSETVNIAIAPGGYVINSPSSATVTIADNEPFVSITASRPNANESGDTGEFTVTRNANLSGDLAVNVTVTGTAASDTDFAALAVPVVIPDGLPSATITVAPIDDLLAEPSETVIATLAPGAYGINPQNSATVTIADDEPFVSIAVTDSDAAEPDNPGTVTITRTGSTANPLSVNLTVTGSATPGVDYAEISSPVVVPAGASSLPIAIVPNDDLDTEGNESATISLATDPGYTIASPPSATLTIRDDDINNPPVITMTSPTVANVCVPNSTVGLMLEAVATDDGKPYVPGTFTSAWSVASAPTGATVTFDNATSPITGARFSAAGVYVLRLTVDDTELQTIFEQRVFVGGTGVNTAVGGDVGTFGAGSPPGSHMIAGGAFTLSGAGNGLSNNNSDGFYFLRQSWTGNNWEIIARVESISGGNNASSRAGIMVRNGTTSANAEVFIGVAGNGRLVWVTRAISGNNAVVSTTSNIAAPRWLRIVRSGNTFTGYHSTNGTTWTQSNSSTVGNVGNSPSAGLAVTGASTSPATAVFTNVSLALTNNISPDVTAGPDRSSEAGVPLNLAGAAPDDNKPAPPGAVAVQWTKRSGPGPVVFGNVNAASTTATLTVFGTYVLRLTANDGQAKTFDEMIDTLPLPSVTVAALANAAEYGLAGGSFRISRTGSTFDSLVVPLTVTGTAIPDADYTAIASGTTIPIGASDVILPVTPRADGLSEGDETVVLTALAGSGYTLGSPSSATVTIADVPFDRWRFAKFGPDANTPAIAGDLADPDHDGLTNLAEYSGATDPLAVDAGISFTLDATALAITYRRNLGATDLLFGFEESSGIDYAWSQVTPTEQILSDNGAVRVIRASIPATGAAQHFLRLVITRLPP